MLDGVSAEDSERLLVRPLEQQLRNLEGLKEMVSSATENRASVTLEFGPEVDVDQALTDVRERVDQAKAELPDDAREPTVNEVKFSRFDPMLVINLGGNLPERTMNTIATDLQDHLQAIDGVLEVNMVGIRKEILEIVVNPLNLESYGLSPADVLNFVQRNNRLVAAGSMQSEQGRFAVKVPGVIESPEDVLALPMKVDGERVVHFRDIAEVRRTFKDPESYAAPEWGARGWHPRGPAQRREHSQHGRCRQNRRGRGAAELATRDIPDLQPGQVGARARGHQPAGQRRGRRGIAGGDLPDRHPRPAERAPGRHFDPGLLRRGLRAARRDGPDHEHGRVLRPHHVRGTGGGRRHRGGRAGRPAHG